MTALALSLVLTGLLLALPLMTWAAHKARNAQADHQGGKVLFRLLAGCTVVAWGVQALRYVMLALAQGPIEVRQVTQLTAPFGWLVWLAAVTGLAAYLIIRIKRRHL